jgi:hypothetical protein
MSNELQDRNLDVSKAQGTTPGTANTEFAVPHILNRIPITIVGQDGNNGGLLYRSTTPWTKTTAYLKCTTAGMVYNLVLA